MSSPADPSRRAALALLGTLAASPAAQGAEQHRRSDQITAFPGFARRLADGRLQLRVEAWISRSETNRIATWLMARMLGLDLDELSDAERTLFRRRAALFGVDVVAGRQLQARFGALPPVELPASDRLGRVQATLHLHGPSGAVAGDWLPLRIGDGEPQAVDSRVQWLADEGLMLVSDIDDTIKHTLVRQRREMLLNTFARPFTAVPGMADWYRRIAEQNPGAGFLYLSAGPMQMLAPVSALLGSEDFPAGAIRMRAVALRPSAWLDLAGTAAHKRAAVEQLLADFPQRRFVLVGDSGEQDPEIYGGIARDHPARVAEVLIRDVTGDAAGNARYAQAFAGVAAGVWRLFGDPAGLPVRWS